MREVAQRRLPPEDFERITSAPLSEKEREGILELLAWFRRRYPSPGERLAYARRAYARWKQAAPGA
jgi:hypothetical protein